MEMRILGLARKVTSRDPGTSLLQAQLASEGSLATCHWHISL
jgi:hypothetical protein